MAESITSQRLSEQTVLFSISQDLEEVFVVPSALHNVAFVGGQCFLARVLGKIPGQRLCVAAGVLLVFSTGAVCSVPSESSSRR